MRRVTGSASTFALSSNDLILGLLAAALVVFALVVSLVLPRRDAAFPGRRVGVFFAVALLLVAGMLAAVEALGESHDFGAAHGESGEAAGTEQTTPADTQPAETGQTGTGETGQTETGGTGTGGAAEGDPAAGQEVFSSAGCGSCHALAAAGSTGTIGPNLDEGLQGKDAAFIRTQIVDPDSDIAEGYGPGIMPQDFGEQLSDEELADLVAFLAREAG
jgi:mono/diheme cytochrome c family protein